MPESWIKLIRRHGLKVMLNLTADKGSTVFSLLRICSLSFNAYFFRFSLTGQQYLMHSYLCTHDPAHYHSILFKVWWEILCSFFQDISTEPSWKNLEKLMIS